MSMDRTAEGADGWNGFRECTPPTPLPSNPRSGRTALRQWLHHSIGRRQTKLCIGFLPSHVRFGGAEQDQGRGRGGAALGAEPGKQSGDKLLRLPPPPFPLRTIHSPVTNSPSPVPQPSSGVDGPQVAWRYAGIENVPLFLCRTNSP